MTDLGGAEAEPPPAVGRWDSILKHFGPPVGETLPLTPEPEQIIHEKGQDEQPRAVEPLGGQDSKKVVTGLPRSQTFKRQLSEQRMHLEPVIPTADERRAASVDRRCAELNKGQAIPPYADPHSNAPELLSANASVDGYGFLEYTHHFPSNHSYYELSNHVMDPVLFDSESRYGDAQPSDTQSTTDVSISASQHEAMIADELAQKWILNLSMHFRDRSQREKFFVTYRENEHLWRRVTISLDYRDAPPDSLEMDLSTTAVQREKSAKIYEAIRDSLADIKFYPTVTNLKLETTGGRLHVHVVEDGNEIIDFPTYEQVRHLNCRRVHERDIIFDSHLSGFVYKVYVNGQALIKKEIPSPDTVEEFLYEVNALRNLRYSRDIVKLHGVVVDDHCQQVKGLLISYAEQGALTDILYDISREEAEETPWPTRQRWARQIVQGLSDIHESGFVQGDLTLSNIVVDADGDAKIIDINRRGCPVGWEPPEMTALIDARHRITMHIGVKSDLYQLGMVLWALAMLDHEPEAAGRPLVLGPEINVPDWYRQMTEICLNAEPRKRLAASALLHMFPPDTEGHQGPIASADDTRSLDEYSIDYAPNAQPYIKTVAPSNGWQYSSKTYVDTSPDVYDEMYPTRGRSPPRPPPSDFDAYEATDRVFSSTSWAANNSVRPSYNDVDEEDSTPDGKADDMALRPETPLSLGQYDVDSAAYLPTDIRLEDISTKPTTMSVMDRKPSLGDGLQMLPTPKLCRQATAIHVPIRSKTEESDPTTEIPRAEDEPIHKSLDGPPLEISAGHEAFAVHAVSDPDEMKTIESDIDGGVSLGTENNPSSQDSILHNEPYSEAREPSKPHDPMDLHSNTNCLAIPMHALTDMTKRTTCGEDGVSDDTRNPDESRKLTNDNGYKTARLGNFLQSSTLPDPIYPSFPHQRPASLPLALAGIGAGLSFDHETMTLADKANIETDFNVLARPATVQALMATTD